MALNWSFRARLHNASDTMKKRYFELCEELSTYKGVKISESWDKARVYIGRKTYGALLFRGKTLCVALALNPADYVDTKYVFDDISEVAKFVNTPMLVRLSSDRQLKYLRELLNTLFEGIDVIAATAEKTEIPFMEKEELIANGLIKVTKGRKKAEEVDEDDEAPVVTATVAEKVEPEKKVAATTATWEIPESVYAYPKTIINVGTLNDHFESGETVTPEALIAKGLIEKGVSYVKVLADGCLTKQLTVAACAFSKQAKQAIISVGGQVVTIPTK